MAIMTWVTPWYHNGVQYNSIYLPLPVGYRWLRGRTRRNGASVYWVVKNELPKGEWNDA